MTESNLTFLKEKKRRVYLAVPPVGPLAIRINAEVGSVPDVAEALVLLKSQVASLRPDRDVHRALLCLNENIFTQTVHNPDVLLDGLSSAGFNVVGLIKGGFGSDAMSAATDLPVMDNEGKGGFQDFEKYEVRLAAERLEKFLKNWDEAIKINDEINLQKFLSDWEEAIAYNRVFDHEQMLKDWDEAIAMNIAIDHQRLMKCWDEAIAIDTMVNEFSKNHQEVLAKVGKAYVDFRTKLVRGEYSSTLIAANNGARYLEDAVKAVKPYSANVSTNVESLVEVSPQPVASSPSPVESEGVIEPSRKVPSVSSNPGVVKEVRHLDDEPSVDENEEEAGDVAVAVAVNSRQELLHKVFSERVRSGMVINADTSITLLEEVSAGADINSAGDILAHKRVSGRLLAGKNGNRFARIHCKNFNASMINIGGVFVVAEDLPESLIGKDVEFYLKDPEAEKSVIRYRLNA